MPLLELEGDLLQVVEGLEAGLHVLYEGRELTVPGVDGLALAHRGQSL